MKDTLSMKLFNTLQKGKELLGEDALRRVLGFIESQRTKEDSFVNKSGRPDLYYTMFGWILSYALGIRLDSGMTAIYLNKQDAESMDLIHYAAYMRCRMIQRLREKGELGFLLNTIFSTPVRSLQKFTGLPNNDPESPYSQFIWLSLQEDTGHVMRNKKKILEMLSHYQAVEGGFANVKGATMATANATVAALAVTGQLTGYKADKTVTCLQNFQGDSGGFSATPESPIPDILSTATSLFVLKCYGVEPKFSPRDFIEGHWLDSGGFAATLLEETSDVEYTFYGLLALGTL